MPGLEINDRFAPRTDPRFVEQVVAAALAHAGRQDLHVSLLLTDEAEIAEIHGRFLGDATPTDVIAFPLDADSVDVVVSVERARAEAAQRGHAFAAELALYIVHGILHACGYDDIGTRARRRMRRAERAVLERIGLRVAAVDGEEG